MSTISNSLYLDMTSYGMVPDTSALTVAQAYGLSGPATAATHTVNVALFLPRANDPTSLLASDWATRQSTLQTLTNNNTLWTKYGAAQADWDAARTKLKALGLDLIGDATGSDGYISSAESRTIWVTLRSSQEFHKLFGVDSFDRGEPLDKDYLYYWNGSLNLQTDVRIDGLWFDFFNRGPGPAVRDLSSGKPIDIQQGPQSIGNTLSPTLQHDYPGFVAHKFYNYPLSDPNVQTATVALIEPGSGDVLPSGNFQDLLDGYRGKQGLPAGSYYTVQKNGTSLAADIIERSLDVGVVGSAAPGSTIGLYAGSGFGSGAASNVITAYQAAIWDKTHNPAVLSASYSTSPQTAPGSVFDKAVKEIFVDAALRNITILKADNDFGSSWGFANGLANQNPSASSPYSVVVGGTSISSLGTAMLDETVIPLVADASSNQLHTLWKLVAGGLTMLPTSVVTAPGQVLFLEAAWNAHSLNGLTWTGPFGAGDGGVDTNLPTPAYQTAYGLTPTSANPGGGTGRGAPDVAANAGGNLFYSVPKKDMTDLSFDDGTSAAAPMWAALTAQVDTIFKDQGLRNLGYMNDLLYIAAAIAPGSFNDIRYGNNIASFYFTTNSDIVDTSNKHLTLTGHGYQTGEDYDLVTGLGSPNGTLLARSLTAIAHSQVSFSTQSKIVEANGAGWKSGANQTVLVQLLTEDDALVDLTDGLHSLKFSSSGAEPFAWTNRLAQQSLQSDFDPRLVRLFDKQHHGAMGEQSMSLGDSVSVSIDGGTASGFRVSLTNTFGFADFASSDGGVRLARAVAVAETAGGANDQQAIVRVRQNGEDSLSVSFYRVDDLSGKIGALHPGDAGYAAAAQGRAYQVTTGGTAINGPGYGNYAQAGLINVDAGDLVAMKLTNNTSGNVFWAFSQANETVDGRHVGHLWNYGLNTWGWEDTLGGGDRDFNDLVVGLDFTSAAGHGWLV